MVNPWTRAVYERGKRGESRKAGVTQDATGGTHATQSIENKTSVRGSSPVLRAADVVGAHGYRAHGNRTEKERKREREEERERERGGTGVRERERNTARRHRRLGREKRLRTRRTVDETPW